MGGSLRPNEALLQSILQHILILIIFLVLVNIARFRDIRRWKLAHTSLFTAISNGSQHPRHLRLTIQRSPIEYVIKIMAELHADAGILQPIGVDVAGVVPRDSSVVHFGPMNQQRDDRRNDSQRKDGSGHVSARSGEVEEAGDVVEQPRGVDKGGAPTCALVCGIFEGTLHLSLQYAERVPDIGGTDAGLGVVELVDLHQSLVEHSRTQSPDNVRFGVLDAWIAVQDFLGSFVGRVDLGNRVLLERLIPGFLQPILVPFHPFPLLLLLVPYLAVLFLQRRHEHVYKCVLVALLIFIPSSPQLFLRSWLHHGFSFPTSYTMGPFHHFWMALHGWRVFDEYVIGRQNEMKRHLVVYAARCAFPTLTRCIGRRRGLSAFALGRRWIDHAEGEEGKIVLC